MSSSGCCKSLLEEAKDLAGRALGCQHWSRVPDAGKLVDVGVVETFGEAVHPVCAAWDRVP